MFNFRSKSMRTRHVIQTRMQFPYGFAGMNKQHRKNVSFRETNTLLQNDGVFIIIAPVVPEK